MCGLLGVYATTFASAEFTLFQNLLFLNVFRGSDSTGIIRVEKDKRVRSVKSLLASPDFLKNQASDIAKQQTGVDAPLALLGHTRHATKGAVTLKNAHPFSFPKNSPKLFGMHNGTIHTPFKHRNAFDTDSEALYKNIQEDGIEKALNEVSAWDSAYALQWVDAAEGTLNFVKNDKRDLHFTYIYAGTTLIWSSEMDVLEFLVGRKKMLNKGWEQDEKDKIFTLHDNHLMSIKLGETPANASMTKLDVKEKKTNVWISTPNGGHRRQTVTDTLEGEWVQTESGYKFVEKARPTLIVDNTKKKTTGTAGSGSGSQSNSTSLPGYKDFKDRFGPEELARLSWLRPVEQRKAESKSVTTVLTTNQDNEIVEEYECKGYQGVVLSEKEFRHHLSNGCICCGEIFDMDNPEDFKQIQKIEWGARDFFACHECYSSTDEDKDWVRYTIDGVWSKVGVK